MLVHGLRPASAAILERWKSLLNQLAFDEQQAASSVIRWLQDDVEKRWREQLFELSSGDGAVAAIREELCQRRTLVQGIEKFLREHLRRLVQQAARLAGPHNANDIVQEASVSLMKCSAGMLSIDWDPYVAENGGMPKLMHTIVARRAYDFLRQQQRNRQHVTADGDPPDRGDDTVTQRVEAALDVARVEAAYCAMPIDHRIAHILHYWYGFTAKECAAVLDSQDGVDKVEKWISRATAVLKRAMEKKS